MRIALRIPTLPPSMLGVTVYMHNHLSNLASQAPGDWELVAYTSGRHKTDWPYSAIRHTHIPLPNRVLEWASREDLFINSRMLFGKCNLIHDHTSDWIPNDTRDPIISTIHDICILRPQVDDYPEHVRRDTRAKLERIIAKAKVIVAISEFTKAEICSEFDIDECRIKVIHNGVDHHWFKPSDEALDSRSSNKKFALYAGGYARRKNVSALLQAFETIKSECGSELELVMTGHAPRHLVELTREKELPVRWTGMLDAQSLLKLYQTAHIFVFPSVYEGFGMPPVEAMACGVPVASSNAECVKEVVGDAAIQFDPHAPQNIAEVITRLAHDDQLQAEYRQRGLARARLYSWQRNATETLQLYKEIAG